MIWQHFSMEGGENLMADGAFFRRRGSSLLWSVLICGAGGNIHANGIAHFSPIVEILADRPLFFLVR
jgi:hypothetical protein